MARRRHGHNPKFSLSRIQELVAWGRYRVTRSARLGAHTLYLEESDIVDCVRALRENDYEKTLPGETFPGRFQDVYRPRFHGFEIYLKVQMVENRDVVIISFKRSEEQ